MDGTPSPLEERIWKQMSRALGLRNSGTLADNPDRLDWFRSDLRNTAYHEAGHVAVDAFFWYTYGHIRYVSIMPKRQSAGNCLADRCPSLDSIQRLGREAGTPHVWKRMMIALAGWCAVRVVGGHCIDRFTVSDEIGDIARDPAQWDCQKDEPLPDTDFSCAWQVAQQFASCTCPWPWVMAQGAVWTGEVLSIPEVWSTVEAAAADLLKRGTIRHGARMDRIFSPALGLWFEPPHKRKWSRRLTVRIPKL